MEQTLPAELDLKVVTPDRQVVHEKVVRVTVPGREGYLGILPGHAPLLTELQAGELVYALSGRAGFLALSWGFAEVLPDRVIILAQTAERPEEIDVNRAHRARQRAEDRMKKSTEAEIDLERARAALARALARIQVAERLPR